MIDPTTITPTALPFVPLAERAALHQQLPGDIARPMVTKGEEGAQ